MSTHRTSIRVVPGLLLHHHLLLVRMQVRTMQGRARSSGPTATGTTTPEGRVMTTLTRHRVIVVRLADTNRSVAFLVLNEADVDRQLDGIRRTYGSGCTVAIEEMSTP